MGSRADLGERCSLLPRRTTRRSRDPSRLALTVTELVYQHPTADGMVIAGTSASTALKSDLLFDPVDIRVEGAYPITTAVWVAYRSDRKMSAATRSSLTAMLTSSAQSELQGLGFAALPRNVLAAARAAFAKAR